MLVPRSTHLRDELNPVLSNSIFLPAATPRINLLTSNIHFPKLITVWKPATKYKMLPNTATTRILKVRIISRSVKFKATLTPCAEQ
jgi:hypothetical protein